MQKEMLRLLKSVLPYELRQRLKRSLVSQHDMLTRLTNLRRAGFEPKWAVDGGAFEGYWTKLVWKVWPSLPCLLVEPQHSKHGLLTTLARKVRGSQVFPVAIGSKPGFADLRLDESNSSIVPDGEPETCCRVEMKTLSQLVQSTPNFIPSIVKLDLQGHELEAITGIGDSLALVEVIVLEVSVLRIGDVPIAREVDRFMERFGFVLYDILPMYYRPKDGALWQFDAFYVREDSALVSNRDWA